MHLASFIALCTVICGSHKAGCFISFGIIAVKLNKVVTALAGLRGCRKCLTWPDSTDLISQSWSFFFFSCVESLPRIPNISILFALEKGRPGLQPVQTKRDVGSRRLLLRRFTTLPHSLETAIRLAKCRWSSSFFELLQSDQPTPPLLALIPVQGRMIFGPPLCVLL